MKLSISNETGVEEVNEASWSDIKSSLRKLDGIKRSHVIMNNETKSYVQCVGSPSAMAIEYRIYGEKGFRHYVLGYGGNKSPLVSTWVYLETGVGQIAVHKNEVLVLEDAERVFRSFFDKGIIPVDMMKRNVTKLHL